MKKYLYIFAAAMMAACADTIDETTSTTAGVGQADEAVTIICKSIEQPIIEPELDLDTDQEKPVTRTTQTLEGGTYWQKWAVGDELSFSKGLGQSKVYRVDRLKYEGDPENEAAHFATADGTSFLESLNAGDKVYVAYPSAAIEGAPEDRGGWVNGSTVKGLMYAEQDYYENKGICDNKANGFGAYMAAAGEVQDWSSVGGTAKVVELEFNMVSSVIDVFLDKTILPDGEIPMSLSIKSNSGVSIAGAMQYNFESGSFTVSTTDQTGYSECSQSDVVKVNNLPADLITNAATGQLVRFHVLPVMMEGGITITLETKRTVAGKDYFSSYTKLTKNTIGNNVGATPISNVLGADGTPMANVASKPIYRKITFGAISAVTRRNDWMSSYPSNMYLSLISVPGVQDPYDPSVDLVTPDANGYNTITDIPHLLNVGVRAINLRIGREPQLYLWHHTTRAEKTLTDCLGEVTAYLEKHPSETIFLLVRRADGALSKTLTKQEWGQKVYEAIHAIDAKYIVDNFNAKTTLHQCRGKIVFLNLDQLYDGETPVVVGAGLDSDGWGDNCAITSEFSTSTTANPFIVSHQDISDDAEQEPCNIGISAYLKQQGGVRTAAQKVQLIKRFIDEACVVGAKKAPEPGRFFINYCDWKDAATTQADIMVPVLNHIGTKKNRVGMIIGERLKVKNVAGTTYAPEVVTTEVYAGPFLQAIVTRNFEYVFRGRSRTHTDNDWTGADVLDPPTVSPEGGTNATQPGGAHVREFKF